MPRLHIGDVSLSPATCSNALNSLNAIWKVSERIIPIKLDLHDSLITNHCWYDNKVVSDGLRRAETERSKSPCCFMDFFHGDHGKENLICPLISSDLGLQTSRYTRARSKMQEIACDRGTDFPKTSKRP